MNGCRGALSVLVAGARDIGLALGDVETERFVEYCRLLLEVNQHTNLTAIRDPEGVMRTLFLDSIAIMPALPGTMLDSEPRVVDVGAGAGFPSVPLKILLPGWRLALVESVSKKAEFLERVMERLGLSDVTVHNRRAEELGRQTEWRDAADLCLARAVSALPSLIELCAPLVRTGGYLVLPKSGPIQQEIRSADEAARRLHTRLVSVVDVPEALGLGESRATVVYEKTAPTPGGYPRRTGLAQSRPISSAP